MSTLTIRILLVGASFVAVAAATGCGDASQATGAAGATVTGTYSFSPNVGLTVMNSGGVVCVSSGADAGSSCSAGPVEYDTAEVNFGVGTGTPASCPGWPGGKTGLVIDGYGIGMELGFPGGGITSPSSYVGSFPAVPSANLDDGGFVSTPYAAMGVGTVGPDGGVTVLAHAVSGTVHVTSADAAMRGTFDVGLRLVDGGSGTLSGAFDTPLCK